MDTGRRPSYQVVPLEIQTTTSKGSSFSYVDCAPRLAYRTICLAHSQVEKEAQKAKMRKDIIAKRWRIQSDRITGDIFGFEHLS